MPSSGEATRLERFFCDAMLGGLARWLRAAGYDAAFEHGIADPDLVVRARQTGRVVLSSDSGLFERSVLRDGVVPGLFVPRALGVTGELSFVLERFGLEVREPRCMACGGALLPIAKESVRGEAPPCTFERQDEFFRCARCAKLFWRGTHWERIEARLARLGPPAR